MGLWSLQKGSDIDRIRYNVVLVTSWFQDECLQLFWCRLKTEREAMQLFHYPLEITCSMITSPSPPPPQHPLRSILRTLLYLYSCKCHLCFWDQKHTSYKETKSGSPHDPKERESCKHPPGSQGAISGHKGSEHNKHDQRGRKIGEKDVVDSNQTTS